MHRKIIFVLILFYLFFYLIAQNPLSDQWLEAAIYQTKNDKAKDVNQQGDRSLIESSNAVYLTLDEVTKLALNNNFDIQLAQFDAQLEEADLDRVNSIYDTIIQAEADFKEDRTKSSSSFAGTKTQTRNYNLGVSKKLPTGSTLELDLQNERSWTNSAYTTINPVYDSSVRLALKQELGKNFFGIKDRTDVLITKIDIQNAQYTSFDKIEQMLARIQKTYWRVVQYLNIVRIREEMLSKAQELYQINKEKISKGIIEEPQLFASEANLRQKEIDSILANNNLQLYINELKLLLNLENDDRYVLPSEELIMIAESTKLTEVLKTAFIHRRDYYRAKNEVESQNLNLVMKKNNLWPEIDLEVSITRNGLDEHLSSAIKDISSEDNPEYFLGLTIKLPLENREAKSQLKKANIQKAKALLNLKRIERQILVQVQDSVRTCNILKERVDKQSNVVRLQEDKLSAELKAYQYGRSDTDTVIRYQDDLLVSELLYIQSLLDYKEALIELSLTENILLDYFWENRL